MAFQWNLTVLPESSLWLGKTCFAARCHWNLENARQIETASSFSVQKGCCKLQNHSNSQTGLKVEECLISTSLSVLPAKSNRCFQRRHSGALRHSFLQFLNVGNTKKPCKNSQESLWSVCEYIVINLSSGALSLFNKTLQKVVDYLINFFYLCWTNQVCWSIKTLSKS